MLTLADVPVWTRVQFYIGDNGVISDHIPTGKLINGIIIGTYQADAEVKPHPKPTQKCVAFDEEAAKLLNVVENNKKYSTTTDFLNYPTFNSYMNHDIVVDDVSIYRAVAWPYTSTILAGAENFFSPIHLFEKEEIVGNTGALKFIHPHDIQVGDTIAWNSPGLNCLHYGVVEDFEEGEYGERPALICKMKIFFNKGERIWPNGYPIYADVGNSVLLINRG